MKKILYASVLAAVSALLVNPVTSAEAADAVNVRVGSFNIQSVSLDKYAGEQKPWKERRGTVIGQILNERLDVVGLQEANQSKFFAPRLVAGVTQMTDLRNGLNRAGGNYQLTNSAAFNCENMWTKYKCVPRYRAASGDNRILFNADTIERVRQGTYTYRTQGSSFTAYVPWAVLRAKATGREFFFANTHLTTGAESLRRAQWLELITVVTDLRGSLPVFVVGDFNTHKFSNLAADMLPAMRRNGFGDVLGQQAYTNRLENPRADHRVNSWINSYNRLTRNVREYSYYDKRDRAGNVIDWIFASNALNVPEYKLVLNYGSDLRVNGTMQSDHNMVRATVTIP